MLDVGCGTAEHLRFLVGYQMVGLDIDPTFIRLAKRKLPSAEFYVGDMRQFQLGLKFDVILCLFSSIGYLLQRHELRLLSREQWFDLFRSADLEVEYLSEGLTARGLYVARA